MLMDALICVNQENVSAGYILCFQVLLGLFCNVLTRKKSGCNYMVVTADQGQTNALQKGKISLVHPGLAWILQEKKKS